MIRVDITYKEPFHLHITCKVTDDPFKLPLFVGFSTY